MEALPGPPGSSSFVGGPIATDPNPIHVPGVKGITSQMTALYLSFMALGSGIAAYSAGLGVQNDGRMRGLFTKLGSDVRLLSESLRKQQRLGDSF